jgi:hypothetical protein
MKRSAVYAPDTTGKVFVMRAHGMRRCLIYEEWFETETALVSIRTRSAIHTRRSPFRRHSWMR